MISTFWINFNKKLLEAWHKIGRIRHSWVRILLEVLVAIAQAVVGILTYIPLKVEDMVLALKSDKAFSEIVTDNADHRAFEINKYDLELYARRKNR
jgi:hypothetical protein